MRIILFATKPSLVKHQRLAFSRFEDNANYFKNYKVTNEGFS